VIDDVTGDVIKVLIADDQAAVRDGLRLLLDGEPGVELVGSAVDGADLVAQATRRRPDVVLTDIRMPRMDGLAAIRALLGLVPAPAVVALTTFDIDEYVFGALQAGAVGFLLKDGPAERYVQAVRAAHDGQGWIDPPVVRRLAAHVAATAPQAPPPAAPQLTARETDVLRCLARGASNAEIGAALHITPGTAKLHVARILAKLGLRTRAQAAVYACRQGLGG
jgi:DNA-binding NarL/FixJ family response regulator